MKTRLWLYAAILMLVSSCAPQFYSPNVVNVPLLQKKGDLLINASFGGGKISSGPDVQGAYAMNDHFGVMTNLMFYSGSGTSNYTNGGVTIKDTRKASQFLAEAGAGYFTHTDGGLLLETYIGIGGATVHNEGPYDYTDSSGKNVHAYYNLNNPFSRVFNITSIGYRGSNIEVAFSFRNALVMQQRVTDPQVIQAISSVQEFNNSHQYLVYDPALTIRAGFKQFKFQAQLCYSNNITNSNFPQERIHTSFGVIYRFVRD